MPCANSESTIPTILRQDVQGGRPHAGRTRVRQTVRTGMAQVGRPQSRVGRTAPPTTQELALNLVFGVASAGLGALGIATIRPRIAGAGRSPPLPSIAPNPLKPWNPLDLPISANFARSANNPAPTSIFRSVRFRSAIEAAVGTARNCTKLRLEGMRLRAKILAQLRGWDINSQHE